MLALIAVSLEVGSRLFWKIKHGVSLTRGSHILYVFYPNVERLRSEVNRPDEDHLDILLLGGSVVDEMRDGFRFLGERAGDSLRFHVAARVAHTTLDSRRKYRLLQDLPYDELLVYHGINDCKYNSVPDQLFDDEYSAYPFYKSTAALLRERRIDWLTLPYTLRFAWIQARHVEGREWDKPVVTALPEWTQHGTDVKTARTFRLNLEEILGRSQQAGQTVHLATFASYIPQDYTEERFRAGELDYANPRLRVEVWGEAADVRRCIEIHNEIIRDLAGAYPHARLVEVEQGVSKTGSHFDDACHFTPRGQELFFETLEEAL
jgi:hypothetical protein